MSQKSDDERLYNIANKHENDIGGITHGCKKNYQNR